MAIQMILCLETNKKANTDYIYIKETIDFLYQKNNQIKISPLYMSTKTKYKSGDIIREIAKKKKGFAAIGQTKVIYCIDTDEFEKNVEHANAFQDIRQYCEAEGYELIWFCHDVEEVFQGKKNSDSQKVREAGAFRNKKMIMEIPPERLKEKVVKPHTSNIVNILDQYLKRK